MRRWDFVAAYLQGELLDDEVVYCYPPPGYKDHADFKDKLLRVEKPIYGMAGSWPPLATKHLPLVP